MRYINLHTHQSTNPKDAIEIVNQYPKEVDDTIPHYSVGIHPWYIDTATIDEDLEIMEHQLKLENCLAVGECGLDKRITIPLELQETVFEKQLLLAQKYNKPVIIHCVAAFQEVITIKKKMKMTVPMIIHGFSKHQQVATSLIDNGFYISFGKYLLRNPDLEPVFKSVPDEKIFLETDTVEEGITAVYALASQYKSMEEKELQQIICSNFETVFNKKI
ncbi:MAG TPA: TatD family hydrolase [Flavobacterium sp.]|jgi:TatD DNase family protein